MNVETMEKAFLTLSGGMLVLFLGALVFASAGMGVMITGRSGEIAPADVRSTPPFDAPGVTQGPDGVWEAVVISQAWAFQPNEIRIPAGATVRFRVTTVDVIHGFKIDGTLVNSMVIPGQITEITHTFEEAGEHLIICHEYCGTGHHLMYGRVIVE